LKNLKISSQNKTLTKKSAIFQKFKNFHIYRKIYTKKYLCAIKYIFNQKGFWILDIIVL